MTWGLLMGFDAQIRPVNPNHSYRVFSTAKVRDFDGVKYIKCIEGYITKMENYYIRNIKKM